MKAKPLATFHIRPEARARLSVRIEVYRTTAEFRQAVRHEDIRAGHRPSRTRGLVGCCSGVTLIHHRRGKPDRKAGLFAIVRLPRRHLTMSTITHEAFHATMRWAARRGITEIPTSKLMPRLTLNIGSIEERCATVHDELCRRIVRECNRRGLTS